MAETTNASGGMDAADRRAEIMHRLKAAGFLSVTYLTGVLGVSDMTVRRDLKRLSRDGELRVVHGGASLPHGALRTADFGSRVVLELAAKQRIGRHAARLIRPGTTIAIDAGTTPYELAVALPTDFAGCVITHSVPVLQHMLAVPSARMIGLGGELLAESQALVGALTVEALAGLHAEIVFLGAAAVNSRGVFASADLERPTKQALINSADRVVLLADHTKFDASAPVRLAGLDQIDCLVTDRQLDPQVAQDLAAAEVTLHVASEHGAPDEEGTD